MAKQTTRLDRLLLLLDTGSPLHLLFVAVVQTHPCVAFPCEHPKDLDLDN